jgi:hypothetical protein
MMTRQWQIGEFQGEDAGSPVQTRVRSTSAVLSRAHMGELTAANVESRLYDPTKTPLETLVERRAMRPASATDTRMLTLTVDAGLRFLRMLELDPVPPSTGRPSWPSTRCSPWRRRPLQPPIPTPCASPPSWPAARPTRASLGGHSSALQSGDAAGSGAQCRRRRCRRGP